MFFYSNQVFNPKSNQKNLTFEPPPNSDRFAHFLLGALNVCRLVDDEERRMTIEALKQRKVEAR